MKPDWKDAPQWANYLAQDEDGSWYWYEDEPDNYYLEDGWFNNAGGKVEDAYIPKNDGWKDTLEERGK